MTEPGAVLTYPRPGWGARHPGVARFLASAGPPLQSETLSWGGGSLRASAYGVVPPELEPPDEVVSSVRCIVRVETYVVVCRNADGIRHAWPGGRREPGETFVETAVREVHEETGWLVDPRSFRPLGWLHLEQLTPVAPTHPFPHPDCFQTVYEARARSRAGSSQWTDTEGYEISSELVLADEADRFLGRDPMSALFLGLALAGA